jgi:hypothetical protein
MLVTENFPAKTPHTVEETAIDWLPQHTAQRPVAVNSIMSLLPVFPLQRGSETTIAIYEEVTHSHPTQVTIRPPEISPLDSVDENYWWALAHTILRGGIRFQGI